MVLAELRLWNIERNKDTKFYNQLICVDIYDVKHEEQTNIEESVLGLHYSRIQISCGWNESWIKKKTLRPRQNGRNLAGDISKCISFSKTFGSVINVSLILISSSQINNKPSLVQIMVSRRTGDKTLFEPMVVKCTDAYIRRYASKCKCAIGGYNQFDYIQRICICGRKTAESPYG